MRFSAKSWRSRTSCTLSAFATCCGRGTRPTRTYETWKPCRSRSTRIFPRSFEVTWRLWSSVSSSSTVRSPLSYTCTTRTRPNNQPKPKIKRAKASTVLRLKSTRTIRKASARTVPASHWICATQSGFNLIATLEAARQWLRDGPTVAAQKTSSQSSKRASRMWISPQRARCKAAITFWITWVTRSIRLTARGTSRGHQVWVGISSIYRSSK